MKKIVCIFYILIINQLHAQSQIITKKSSGSSPITSSWFNHKENFINYLFDPIGLLKQEIRKSYQQIPDFLDHQRDVRQGINLSIQELEFIKNRMPIVQKTLHDNFQIDAPLKIGLASSGGGNRAMLASLGVILGLEQIGLWDTLLYCAGLSGSTWTFAPYSYFYATEKINLSTFKKRTINAIRRIAKPISVDSALHVIPKFSQFELNSIYDNFFKRFAFDQYISSIDIYGTFIGNFALSTAGDKRFDINWSSIAPTIINGNIPLPLGSAVSFESVEKHNHYYWFEFNPFEVGSDQLQAYIPIQSFGSQYYNGKVVASYAGHAPEYPLSFYLGMFGSAFTASLTDLVKHLGKKDFKIGSFNFSLEDLLHYTRTTSEQAPEYLRFSPATFYNYTYGLPNHKLCFQKNLKLFDAGMDFNIPLPLLMRPERKLDLIIMNNANNNSTVLNFAEEFFIKEKIPFPALENYKIEDFQKIITILNDPRSDNYNPNIITIIYLPLVKNNDFSTTFDPVQCIESGFCQTLNFNYSQEQANLVIGLMEFNIKQAKDEIISVIQSLAHKKNLLSD